VEKVPSQQAMDGNVDSEGRPMTLPAVAGYADPVEEATTDGQAPAAAYFTR
jgi:hypothetical protein